MIKSLKAFSKKSIAITIAVAALIILALSISVAFAVGNYHDVKTNDKTVSRKAINGEGYSERCESEVKKAEGTQFLHEDAIFKESQAKNKGDFVNSINSELVHNTTLNGIVTICIDPGHGGS
ncbi:MAG: hypothetical protein HUJ51_02630, partial [Eggerthellaceae bacterium]|nr:hypothetical protein [Eggerthellaceae bacterium]